MSKHIPDFSIDSVCRAQALVLGEADPNALKARVSRQLLLANVTMAVVLILLFSFLAF